MRRVYIEAEEKQLRETAEALVREESWKPMEDAAQTNVLRSASELFAVIKKSLQRCARFVSRGEPMLLLMGAFQVGAHKSLLSADPLVSFGAGLFFLTCARLGTRKDEDFMSLRCFQNSTRRPVLALAPFSSFFSAIDPGFLDPPNLLAGSSCSA